MYLIDSFSKKVKSDEDRKKIFGLEKRCLPDAEEVRLVVNHLEVLERLHALPLLLLVEQDGDKLLLTQDSAQQQPHVSSSTPWTKNLDNIAYRVEH